MRFYPSGNREWFGVRPAWYWQGLPGLRAALPRPEAVWPVDWLVPSHASPLALCLAAGLLETLFCVLYLFASNSSHFAFSALFFEMCQLRSRIFCCFSEACNHVPEPNCLFCLSDRSFPLKSVLGFFFCFCFILIWMYYPLEYL